VKVWDAATGQEILSLKGQVYNSAVGDRWERSRRDV